MHRTAHATLVSRSRRAGGRRRTILALLGVAAAAGLGLASPAGAAPPIGGEPPPPPNVTPKPNLVVEAQAVAASGTSQWQVLYTVSNRGAADARSFRVDSHQDGWGLLKSTAHSALAAGESRSEISYFPRTANCYLAVRFFVDSTTVVAETSESDNVRWAAGHTGPSCATLPKYRVRAVSFHAHDETGHDWAGSDEPYWIFNSVGLPGTERTTLSRDFGDVDTGDTVAFGPSESCIYLSCAGGPAPNGIGLSVQLWERDLGNPNATADYTADAFLKIGGIVAAGGALTFPASGPIAWIGATLVIIGSTIDAISSWGADDLVGSQTWAYDIGYLASRLPTVGRTFDDTRTYATGGGTYTMTVQVARVA